MNPRITYPLAALALILGLAACEKGHPESGTVFRTEAPSPYGAATRSLLTAPDIETKMTGVTLGAYTDGKLAAKAHFTSGFGSMPLDLESGRYYAVYALSNMGDCTGLLPATESGWNGWTYAIPSYTKGKQSLQSLGIPMAGKLEYAEGKSTAIPLERLLARVTVHAACEWEGAAIQSVRVCNLNRTLRPFGEGAAAGTDDILGEQEYHSGTGAASGSFVFYVPENRQGCISGIKESAGKSPDKNLDVAAKKGLLTYLETTVSATGARQGTMTYRSFLGADAVSDFDIRRNASYEWAVRYLADGLQKNDWKHGNSLQPARLEVDLSAAPAYVAQQGYIRITPAGGIVRTDAEVKSGSESVLRMGQAGVSGSMLNIGLSGLSAGTGTVILRHYDATGAEVGTQEVSVTIRAPLLRFSADSYRPSPDGTTIGGSVYYAQADGSNFTSTQKKSFDLSLVKKLLFPSGRILLDGNSPFLQASFVRIEDRDLEDLRLFLQVKVARLRYNGRELPLGQTVDRVRYGAALSTGIADAVADVDVPDPFSGLAGKTLAVIENNLPVYWAFKRVPDRLDQMGITASRAFGIRTYRNGKSFSLNGSVPELEVELPVKMDVPVVVDGPAEFSIACSGKKLVLSAVTQPSRYEGAGRFTLYGHVRHSETGELSSAAEMGNLEIYLIGAAAPYIHEGNGVYGLGGRVIPAVSVLTQAVSFSENTEYTAACVNGKGLYLSWSDAFQNLYYQYDDVDEHGVARYARDGAYAYLNSYLFDKGSFLSGTDFLEFRFGSIFMDPYHEHDLLSAIRECDRMIKPVVSGCTRRNNLWHCIQAQEKDGNGLSYYAFASLFGGYGVFQSDFFIENGG